jgi:hypothetical protein
LGQACNNLAGALPFFERRIGLQVIVASKKIAVVS